MDRPIKYIIMVRDPVERLYSAFRYYLEEQLNGKFFQPEGYAPTAEFFHTYVEEQVRDFQACVMGTAGGWRTSTLRRPPGLRRCIITKQAGLLHSVQGSIYYAQIVQWLQLTGTQLHRDVMVIPFERLKDPRAWATTLNQVYARVASLASLHVLPCTICRLTLLVGAPQWHTQVLVPGPGSAGQ